MLSSFSCVQLCDSMARSPPGFSVHGIFQARLLECIAVPSKGSSGCRHNMSLMFPALAGEFFTTSTPWKPVASLSVQFSRSVVSDSLQPHESQHARPPCPSPTPSLFKLMSIESVMPSSHLILCRPLLLLPPIPLSIRVFSNASALPMR